MTCFNPKPVRFQWYNKIDEKTGEIYKTKRPIFLRWDSDITEQTEWLPCGKCEGCRIDKANDNATKAYLESLNWPKNAFLTLTYDNAHLPKKRTLLKADLQKFWKRLRKHIQPERIKYLACGEYGLKTLRPHYHAAVFNFWPEDAKFYKKNTEKDSLYTSETLNRIWGKGYVIVGQLTYESAAYIARYVVKKAYDADKLPLKAGKEPEFTTCSKRPGLAKNFFEQPERWDWLQRNNGVLTSTKKGVKLKKIPMYLKNLWKKADREDYNTKTEKLTKIAIQNYIEKLKKTDKPFGWYNKDTNETKKKGLKRLDKYRENMQELE